MNGCKNQPITAKVGTEKRPFSEYIAHAILPACWAAPSRTCLDAYLFFNDDYHRMD
jgi:hypothetical protein